MSQRVGPKTAEVFVTLRGEEGGGLRVDRVGVAVVVTASDVIRISRARR